MSSLVGTFRGDGFMVDLGADVLKVSQRTFTGLLADFSRSHMPVGSLKGPLWHYR